jgi:tetratricopeptide (TPR) repeat protein
VGNAHGRGKPLRSAPTVMNNQRYGIAWCAIAMTFASKYCQSHFILILHLGNYANFLKDIRKQYDEAQKYYLKALEIDPEKATINGNYANFLFDIKKQYDEAQKYYLKALEIDPENADINGNYAKHLIICNKRDEAIEYINRAFELIKDVENDQTLELWFYCYAIFPKAYPQSKTKIEELLAKGIQSIGWDLSEILKIAGKEKHPDYKQLIEFEKRITKP